DFGTVVQLSSFSLSNEGDTIRLLDPDGQTIDAVAYLRSWHETGKDEGGFSLERINPSSPCLLGSSNWTSSNAPLGASPGSPNTVLDESQTDRRGPRLIKAYSAANAPNEVQLFFDEALDENSVVLALDFSISPELSPVSASLEPPLYNSVRLDFTTDMSPATTYEIEIGDSVADCVNNSIDTSNTARFALPEAVEPLDIILNEVLYNPETGGSRFVELFNRSSKVIDVIDLHLAKRNEFGNLAFQTFPEDPCLIFPGDYLVLTPSPEDIRNRYFTQNPNAFLSMDVPTYDDREDAVVLLSTGSLIIDELQYTRDFHNELLDDFNGVSLERISPDALTQADASWHSAAAAVGFATPTYENSQIMPTAAPGDSPIRLAETTISPDNDGFQDVLLINYQTEQAGFVANLNIYDARGRLIKNLTENEILASSGQIKWDGTTNDREKARIGIYILWGELIHPDGTVIGVKESLVVAGRLD
ncbi:MAG: lamin tail domain-containing protein, partial [Bacteroidota bacterium]